MLDEVEDVVDLLEELPASSSPPTAQPGGDGVLVAAQPGDEGAQFWLAAGSIAPFLEFAAAAFGDELGEGWTWACRAASSGLRGLLMSSWSPSWPSAAAVPGRGWRLWRGAGAR
jgi:hypothetical protein